MLLYSCVLRARFVNTGTFSSSYNTICLMTDKVREKKDILHFEAQVELKEHITSVAPPAQRKLLTTVESSGLTNRRVISHARAS